jgi:hypothetical protein
LTLTPSFVPVDHAVVGIVNDIQIDEEPTEDSTDDPAENPADESTENPASGGRP